MRLSDQLIELIHGPVMCYLCTRSDSLMPYITQCIGARVGPDQETIDVYVAEVSSGTPLRNLEQNGHFALTVGDISHHDAIQLKGTYLSRRPATDADYAIQSIYFDKIVPHIPTHIRERLPHMVIRPTLVLSLRITDVFNQTPGPGSGNRFTS